MTDSGKLYNTMRRDEYDVDEDGGEEFAAARMVASKMRRVRCVNDERRRKKGWNCGPWVVISNHAGSHGDKPAAQCIRLW